MKIKFAKTAKAAKTPAAPKKKTKILEYYYMTPEQTNAKEMTTFIKSVDEEKIDVWPELNLMEVVLDSDSFMNGISRLVEKLRDSVNKFVLYETWGRKSGSEVLKKNKWTNESMTFEVAMAYERVSQALNIPISHVGLNFYDIYINHKEINLYNEDLSHPSYEGSCLVALTHYVTIFGEFPERTDELTLSPEVISIYRDVILKRYKNEDYVRN